MHPNSTLYSGQSTDKALKHLQVFLEEQYYGVYRGECLLAVADYYLEHKLDVDSAAIWFEKSAKWLDTVKDFDNKIAAYQIPEKVANLSQPPAEERYTDSWGNVVPHKISHASIFNRRTSRWYWNKLRKQVALKQGLLAYVEQNFKLAEKHWGILYKVDPYFKQEEAQGWGSTAGRLVWNIKNNAGALYATPQEMKAFKNSRRRLVVFLADLAYESEDRETAKKHYGDLLASKYGKPNRNEKAYLTYAYAAAITWLGEHEEALSLLKDNLQLFRNTPGELRALLALGNRLLASGKPEDTKKALAYFKILQKRCKNTEEALDSIFISGWVQKKLRHTYSAVRSFRKYIKQKKTGGYVSLTKRFLKEMSNKKGLIEKKG